MNQATMKAVVTLGHGGFDQLSYRDVPVPVPVNGEVLVRVLAAGMNNTEINTRLGWYSADVTGSTSDAQSAQETTTTSRDDGGWNAQTPFPLIQGTDCCGEVVLAPSPQDQHLLGRRVLIRPCIRRSGFNSLDHHWMASDFDGAFAQYVKVAATEVFPVNSSWTDAELGSLPCAYGTAENLLYQADISGNDILLITGASAGVGAAAVQLARCRGAHVIAVGAREKHNDMHVLGADQLVAREESLLEKLGERSVDAVIDCVAGDGFPSMLKLLRSGGRLASSGAIAGPVVDLDMRDLYLKDLRLIGSTAWAEPVFSNLIDYVEHNRFQPVVAKTFPLQDIVSAQQEFLLKKHLGKFVLIPQHL